MIAGTSSSKQQAKQKPSTCFIEKIPTKKLAQNCGQVPYLPTRQFRVPRFPAPPEKDAFDHSGFLKRAFCMNEKSNSDSYNTVRTLGDHTDNSRSHENKGNTNIDAKLKKKTQR